MWALWCQKQVSQAEKSNCIPQYSVGCDYISLSMTSAFCIYIYFFFEYIYAVWLSYQHFWVAYNKIRCITLIGFRNDILPIQRFFLSIWIICWGNSDEFFNLVLMKYTVGLWYGAFCYLEIYSNVQLEFDIAWYVRDASDVFVISKCALFVKISSDLSFSLCKIHDSLWGKIPDPLVLQYSL